MAGRRRPAAAAAAGAAARAGARGGRREGGAVKLLGALVAASALVLSAEAFVGRPGVGSTAANKAGGRLARHEQARARGEVDCSARPPLEQTTWWRDPGALRQATEGAGSRGGSSNKKKGGGLLDFLRFPSSPPPAAAAASPPPSLPFAGWDLRRLAFSLVTPALLAFGGGGGMGVGGGLGGLGAPQAAHAVDTVQVGRCLLENCQLELARCLLDPKCLANIICLNTCNGRADEAGCQIGCGDLFENDVVGQFNACALSKKQCVPQKQDDGSYPLPPDDALVKQFSMDEFKGKWYISAGLNPLFDIFDCQVHFFTVTNGKLYGKLNWRITEPDGEFFTRDTVQRFVQDPEKPAILYNHDNEYLHYQDDWYILDYEPQQFIAVYYRGRNDAWNGYGGAVVYSRSSTVPAKYKDRIKAAFGKANIDYSKFKDVDNSCKDLTESPTALRAEFARRLFFTEEQQLQEALTTARVSAENALMMGEEEAQTAVKELERVILDFEGKLGEEAAKAERALVEEVEEEVKQVGRVIDTRLWKSFNQNKLESLEQKLQSRPLADPRPAVK